MNQPSIPVSEFIDQDTPLDLIICLGCQLNRRHQPTWQMLARVDAAAHTATLHPSATLLFAGGQSYLENENHLSEAETMRDYAIKTHHLNPDKLKLESNSSSTIEQLCIIKNDYIIPQNITSVALASDEFHINRAAYMFDRIMGDHCQLHAVGAPINLSGKYYKVLQDLELGYYDLTVNTYSKFTRGDDKAIAQSDLEYRQKMKQHVASGGDPLKPVKI